MRVATVVLVLALSISAQQDTSKRASPPARAELVLNGKKITIDYSRPSIRDPQTGQPRKIMGVVVPYGEPWRTGANEATTFVTEGDLEVGGTFVPKGRYTLYTLPQEDSWTLIISKKTGQWGIPYPGQSEDFARIHMNVEHLSQTVDPFTITLDPPSAGSLMTLGVGGPIPARLCVAWENTKACVYLVPK